MPNLFPFQADGADYLSSDPGFGCLQWDMGLGKSPTSITAADKIGAKKILVLCPAVALFNWRREWDVWQEQERDIQVILSGKDRPNGDVVICSYNLATNDVVHHALQQKYWDLIVLDEIQYLKTMKSKRTQAVLGFGSYRGRGLTKDAPYVWGLSGTPAPNNISEIYPWLRSLAPDVLLLNGRTMTRSQFIGRYCKGHPTKYGFKITGNNETNLGELRSRIDEVMDRCKKEDVLKNLPAMRFAQVEVDGGDLTQGVLDLEEEYKDQVEELIERGGRIDEHTMKLRRITEMAKVGAAVEIIKADLDDGMDKILIFAIHRDVIDALQLALAEYGCSVVHGGVNAKNREKNIDAFHLGSARVFIGQIQAAGTAITLHANGRCTDALFLSADWVPANNAQAAARIHRAGQTGSVLCRFLHLSGSIDEDINRIVLEKTRNLNEAFNGD